MPNLTVFDAVVRVVPAILTLEAGRYFIVAGLVALVTWVFWRSIFQARKIQIRTAGPADYRREVLASLRTILIFTATGLFIFFAHQAGWLTVYGNFSQRGPIYFALSLVAMIIAHDAYFYWTHRAMHHRRLFRWFHRTHHKSHTPTPWTAYAFDAPEAVVMAAFVPVWLALVPMHDLALYIFMTWQIVRNVAGHAGVELSPVAGKPSGAFGWLNTTTHHDLHHENARFNYGLYFSWWDRLMGTEHPDYQVRVAKIATASGSPLKALQAAAQTAAALVICAGLALSVASDARAQTNNVAGNWATRDFGSIVQIRPCAEAPSTLCGRIVWLWAQNDAAGRPRLGAHNPNQALRARSLVGVEIIRSLRQAESGLWSGELYNPDDGRTYSGDIRLRNGALELRGCAMTVFCETQVWRRAEEVVAALRSLPQ